MQNWNYSQHFCKVQARSATPASACAPRSQAAAAAAAATWQTCRVARAAAGGKDRHSKVVTARGLRDRRVWLSVLTAIQFYDIQDRLGVDQPSKAIEWFIRAASPAIDALPSMHCLFVLPASPPADEAGEDAEVSASETSKTSVLSLANAPGDNGHATTATAHQANAYNGSANGAFAELLHCSSNDKPMQQQQQQQSTLAYYAAQSSHIAPMSLDLLCPKPHAQILSPLLGLISRSSQNLPMLPAALPATTTTRARPQHLIAVPVSVRLDFCSLDAVTGE